MTKHMYQDANLTGVVILGQYQNGDIREDLRKFRDPFEFVRESPNKWLYLDSVMHGGLPVGLTISYEGSHIRPEHILASALSQTQYIDEKYLKGYLDELLEATNIRELDSNRYQFSLEPFWGWQAVSKQM
ncbi:MAG: hypothetical protein KAS15_06050 [Nanoarchaeota archaeon]|nr:hypothetical protein [Nanoarchaeota archaeon]MCK5630877.1 hypothetical protein [Nanoarchaeota archaeon]